MIRTNLLLQTHLSFTTRLQCSPQLLELCVCVCVCVCVCHAQTLTSMYTHDQYAHNLSLPSVRTQPLLSFSTHTTSLFPPLSLPSFLFLSLRRLFLLNLSLSLSLSFSQYLVLTVLYFAIQA